MGSHEPDLLYASPMSLRRVSREPPVGLILTLLAYSRP